MDDIRIWFNGARKYEDGVQLYLKYGKDPLLIKLFTQESYSDFKLKKLTSALDDILSTNCKKPVTLANFQRVVTETPGQIKTEVAANLDKLEAEHKLPEKKWPDVRDPILEALYLKWKPVFAEMMNLVARVGDIARAGKTDPNKKEEAGRMALRILDLCDECDTYYFNRDHYIEKKALPVEKKPIDISLDPLLWPKLLQNHSRYVRQFKRDLEKDPSNIQKAEYLKKHEWAVSEYKKLLKMKD
jgi:hypothetical protein